MSKITSREGEDPMQKEPSRDRGVFTGNSTYQPVHLTDDFVFEHASIMTQQEMADMFRITRDTLMAKFGPAYHAGKAARKMKRRKEHEMLLDQLRPSEDYNHCHPEAKTGDYIKGLTLWYKRYDDLDKPVIEDTQAATTSTDPREIIVKRPTKDDM